MLKRPFSFLAIVLIVSSATFFMPLGVLFGYVFLASTGVLFCIRCCRGIPAKAPGYVSIWMTYLGIIITLHGILLGWDSSLGGAPPSAEMKRLSTWVSYIGGGIAILSILAAYFFTPSKKAHKDSRSLSGFHVEPISAGVASTDNGDQG
ncbi:MAG: hypothetical protein VYB72_13505 [Planctomycetota bacterium]|nr:hypothetical protein [Planctomycetota bacterium]